MIFTFKPPFYQGPAMFDDIPHTAGCGLQEGVPVMAKRMLYVVKNMAEAYVPWLPWSSSVENHGKPFHDES